MKNKISQRDVFWNRIYELAKDNRDIIVISADMGAPALDKFRKDLSSQFVNVGIAEQNAISIAAGLSLKGKKVFVYAIAPFVILRCLEQIRVNCAIMNIPITLVGVGGGFGYDDSGPTHHLIEDIGILRSLPNIEINNVTDNILAEFFAEISCKYKKTNFVRLHRQVLPNIYQEKSKYDFSKGFCIIKEGKNHVLSTGIMTHIVLSILKEIPSVGLIDVFNIPVNPEILKVISKSKKILTIEEHFLPCGMGSNIAEILVDNNLFIPLRRLGIDTKLGYSFSYKYGGWEIIHKHCGLDKGNIRKIIKEFLL